MKYPVKGMAVIIMAVILASAIYLSSGIGSGSSETIEIESEAGIVMDADSGSVIYEKQADAPMYPASLTKVMTTLLALEYGHPDEIVTMTQTGVNYAISGSSSLNTQVGEQFVLRDMLYAIMLKSANDIATQVGEYLGGGSLDTFVQMMNRRAAELGCTNTTFHNACGMPDPDHKTTARDLALIGKACIAREDFREIIGTLRYEIPATNYSPKRILKNRVAMLAAPEYQYPGILGGKTGLTDEAGSCLMTFAEQNGSTLICVTLHAPDGKTAVSDQTRMYDYAFQKLSEQNDNTVQ